MQLHGSLVDNLESALQSARRHRGKPIYADTIGYWTNLLGFSRDCLDVTPNPDGARRLIASLEAELAERAGAPREARP